MKTVLKIAQLLLLFSLAMPAMGNHIIGGDLGYTHLAGNTYRIKLTLYGDCFSSEPFGQLDTVHPVVTVYKSDTLMRKIRLIPAGGGGNDVSPVCPADRANTTCHGGLLPGVYQFIYEDTVTLRGTSTRWSFLFAGILSITTGPAIAGRSVHITNLDNASGGTSMSIVATLDNTVGSNTSPAYASSPTPYYCINQAQSYNQQATDVDGDSLVYSLVPAIDGENGQIAPYEMPYTFSAPLSTVNKKFSFNRLNGQIFFTPDLAQYALVVLKVTEYRKGRPIGTSQRELTFIVRPDCIGTTPTPYVRLLSTAGMEGENVFNVCRGQGTLSFDIGINNPAGDTVHLSASDTPLGAAIVILNNHTAHPSLRFNWAINAVSAGVYTFFLGLRNNQCPIINNQTIAYTVRVVDTPHISVTQLSLTHCVYKAAMKYQIEGGYLPRTIVVRSGTKIISTVVDTAGDGGPSVLFDSLEAGDYSISLQSNAICASTALFTIIDSGDLLVNIPDYSLCLGDEPLFIYIDPVIAGATITWYNPDNSPVLTQPVVYCNRVDTFSWVLLEQFKSCTSGAIPVTAIVHDHPLAKMVSIPVTICLGDPVHLKAIGGETYRWLPADRVKYDTGGAYINIVEPIRVTVVARDRYGCVDSAYHTYTDIQQCCNISFPNAFTPNDDGRNDGWRAVSYGNMKSFDLEIFNRWGQLVFSSGNATARWDGTNAGQPCETGTYYYLVRAQCLTGQEVVSKGDLLLIR